MDRPVSHFSAPYSPVENAKDRVRGFYYQYLIPKDVAIKGHHEAIDSGGDRWLLECSFRHAARKDADGNLLGAVDGKGNIGFEQGCISARIGSEGKVDFVGLPYAVSDGLTASYVSLLSAADDLATAFSSPGFSAAGKSSVEFPYGDGGVRYELKMVDDSGELAPVRVSVPDLDSPSEVSLVVFSDKDYCKMSFDEMVGRSQEAVVFAADYGHAELGTDPFSKVESDFRYTYDGIPRLLASVASHLRQAEDKIVEETYRPESVLYSGRDSGGDTWVALKSDVELDAVVFVFGGHGGADLPHVGDDLSDAGVFEFVSLDDVSIGNAINPLSVVNSPFMSVPGKHDLVIDSHGCSYSAAIDGFGGHESGLVDVKVLPMQHMDVSDNEMVTVAFDLGDGMLKHEMPFGEFRERAERAMDILEREPNAPFLTREDFLDKGGKDLPSFVFDDVPDADHGVDFGE